MSAKKSLIYATVAVFLLLTVSVCAVSLFGAPASAQETVRTAIKCSLYKDADFSAEIRIEIPQNAEVALTGEEVENGFIQVTYGTLTGYVLNRNLYRTEDEIGTDTTVVRVTSEKLGALVDVKEYPMESDTVASIKDGTKVEKVVGGVEYGDYTEIIYNGKRAFIPTANITEGVTYYQTVVIILVVAAMALLGCAVALIVYGKKRKDIVKRGQNGVL